MINKSVLFLLILFIGGVYFFQKKSTEGLVVICLFAIYLLFSGGNEHLTTSENTEAIQNLSSMFQNGTLTATNLTLSGNLKVAGESTLTGNVDGNLNVVGAVNAGSLSVAQTVRVGNPTGPTFDIDSSGNTTCNNLTVFGSLNQNGTNGGNIIRSDQNYTIRSARGDYLQDNNQSGLWAGPPQNNGDWQVMRFFNTTLSGGSTF
jgi:hypothetical protein